MSDDMAEPTENNTQTKTKELKPTKKSHKKAIWITLSVLALILVLPLLVAGWFGFVPGLSGIMGASKPRDLGVVYTEADYASFQQKAGVTFNDFATAPDNPDSPGKKVIFSGTKNEDSLSLTQEEITAAVNSANWLWMPINDTQVRLTGNTVEVSGSLNVAYMDQFISFIGGVGYSQESVNEAVSWGKRFVNNAPVYIKANASISDNQLSFQLQEVQVGRFNVPQDIASRVLGTGSSNAITNTPNLDIKSATITDGAINFVGTHPTIVYVKHQ